MRTSEMRGGACYLTTSIIACETAHVIIHTLVSVPILASAYVLAVGKSDNCMYL
jgi:hypothetical protein